MFDEGNGVVREGRQRKKGGETGEESLLIAVKSRLWSSVVTSGTISINWAESVMHYGK
jgi:hypothetical protein